MSVCRAGHLDGAFDVLRPNGKPNAGGVPNRMLMRRSKLAGPVWRDPPCTRMDESADTGALRVGTTPPLTAPTGAMGSLVSCMTGAAMRATGESKSEVEARRRYNILSDCELDEGTRRCESASDTLLGRDHDLRLRARKRSGEVVFFQGFQQMVSSVSPLATFRGHGRELTWSCIDEMIVTTRIRTRETHERA